jgi:hypothetical protein
MPCCRRTGDSELLGPAIAGQAIAGQPVVIAANVLAPIFDTTRRLTLRR